MSVYTGPEYNPPKRSVAKRKVSVASTQHFCGQTVVPDGENGRIIVTESHLEFVWAIYLLTLPWVQTLEEQVLFMWVNDAGERVEKYFDFVIVTTDGRRIACEVKPVIRLESGRVVNELSQIAAQIGGTFDEVRLLTDEGLDAISRFNAETIYAMRGADAEADLAAEAVIGQLIGASTLADMTRCIGLGARGMRALVRKIGKREITLCEHQRICGKSFVRKTGVSQ